ncbi:UNVERIFIED_CONTAM: hypothetical protein Sradi_7234100 [Sesamum radiatum]|uniref:Transposase MuDR plant domain-containing protein n=1 Tax=Sesamum radiatum TaxID=300843 RepID=A0AAW2IMW1_SESRA
MKKGVREEIEVEGGTRNDERVEGEAVNEEGFGEGIEVEEGARNDERVGGMGKNKGKRKIFENQTSANMSESEFDDSSDSDYVQPAETFDDSDDAPSLCFEDLEDSDDEDIFINKNHSKRQMLMKLSKIVKKQKKLKRKKTNAENNDMGEEEWYSDPEEEEEIDGLHVSDSENDERIPKHPLFKETTSRKNLEFVVGLTFENAQQYREVLRDWCVRKGYDIEFLKNENRRITVKCKHEGCQWRIHASPILKGPTFQIKTIKGEHTCARTYDNSLAKSSYLAKRMENLIRDNPNIPVSQLKNTILRKCNVEVTRWKVIRAKRAALEAIRGADSHQFELLWDYFETVRKHNLAQN